MQYIRGAGGGKNAGNHVPTEADDSLQSVQYATVLDLLSEGEIQGLDDGYKSIYLDGTPVKDANDSDNFEGYSIVTRNGTQGQLHIAALDGTESEQAVGSPVTYTTSVTRQITNVNTDRVRVTLRLPSLRKIEDDGDIIGHEVRVQIQVQYNGGGYNIVKDDTIRGKSSNVYMRDYVLTLNGAFPVDIRVIRVSADDADSKTSSETYWASYTEIIDEKFSYPNSALTYLRFDSRQFSNIPTRKYLIRGIKVKLPSNAKVDISTTQRRAVSNGSLETITNGKIGRVTYSGVWNGTFGAAAWCNDPAWCLYDMLISTRYGPSIPESTLDKWDFYAISQYCNELVSDGRNGQEPRFACNILINSRKDVYRVIMEMTSLFRGMSYYGAGSLAVMQDKPVDSQYLIGPSNVINGDFEYTGVSQKARHTTVSVSYQTYEGLGDVMVEHVEDAEAVAKYGIINKDVKAIGCYSQGQAHRMGLWTLKSEQLLTQTCTFSVGLDSGIVVRPGMVVDIADPVRAGTRRSGRIGASSTTTVMNIDSGEDFSVDITKSPTLSVILPTGVLETKTISGFAPNATPPTITVSSAFSEAPNADSVYLIQTTDVQSQQYRVISVAEGVDGVSAVIALQYNSSIYASVDAGEDIVLRDISNLSAAPDPVTNIAADEFLYSDGQGVFVGCDLSWQHDRKRVTGFRITYRVDNDNWATITTSSPSVSLRQGGNLQVQIQAVNYLNKGSTIVTFNTALAGKTAAPGDVTNFTMIPTNGLARLQWTQSVDLDVIVGGLVRIRHSPALSGVTWANASSIHSDLTGTAKEAYCDLKSGTYLAKFVDSGGRTSVNTAVVEFTKPELANLTNINTQTEDTSFAGTKTDLVVASGELLNAADGSNWETTGTYLFTNNPIDLGDIFNVQLDSTLKVRGFFPGNPFIDTFSDFDNIADFDGATPATCNAEIYIRTTQTDPSSSPTWTTWRPFNNAQFSARGYELKLEVTTGGDNSARIAIEQLRVASNAPTRTITGTGTSSASGDLTVTFPNKFNATPAIGITMSATGSGDYYTIASSSGSAFAVSIYSGGTRQARSFHWTATGYGRGN
jgi:predicted phage tail protein